MIQGRAKRIGRKSWVLEHVDLPLLRGRGNKPVSWGGGGLSNAAVDRLLTAVSFAVLRICVCVLDRFPYMSCEIICCEVPEILKAIANDGGGGGDECPLRKLFSILDGEGDIDSHRAGYLEKASHRYSTRRNVASVGDVGCRISALLVLSLCLVFGVLPRCRSSGRSICRHVGRFSCY